MSKIKIGLYTTCFLLCATIILLLITMRLQRLKAHQSFKALEQEQKFVVLCQRKLQEMEFLPCSETVESEVEANTVLLPYPILLNYPLFCQESKMTIRLPPFQLYDNQPRYLCFTRPGCGPCESLKAKMWAAMCRMSQPVLIYLINPETLGQSKFSHILEERGIAFLPALYKLNRISYEYWNLEKVYAISEPT